MARACQYFVLYLYLIHTAVVLSETVDESVEEPPTESRAESDTVKPGEAPKIEESAEHANGSICAYCSYCKFCKLCEEDCPCTKSRSKPNCHMCKYCKYCTLCSAVCETVCLPGGFLDTVTSAIWNSLPTFDSKMKDAVDQDIDGVKDWIKEYL